MHPITDDAAYRICKRLNIGSRAVACTVTLTDHEDYVSMLAEAGNRGVELRQHDGGGFEIIEISPSGVRKSRMPLEKKGFVRVAKTRIAADGQETALTKTQSRPARQSEIAGIYDKRSILALARCAAHALAERQDAATPYPFFDFLQIREYLHIHGPRAVDLCHRFDLPVSPHVPPYADYVKDRNYHQVTVHSANESMRFRWYDNQRIEIVREEPNFSEHTTVQPNGKYDIWHRAVSARGKKTAQRVKSSYTWQEMRAFSEKEGRALLLYFGKRPVHSLPPPKPTNG